MKKKAARPESSPTEIGEREAASPEWSLPSPSLANAETPLHHLDSWITPTEHFFIREHLPRPRVSLAGWRLVVTGLVEKPLELSYADVERMESATVVNTMECAGNGRAMFEPVVPGIPWVRGAVGNAVFSGPRLADILRRAGVLSGAKHVAFNGIDKATGEVADYIRSIPIEKALDLDTLLATHMNSAPLTNEHGFPVRVLVPGWVGAASVKWLTEVRLLDCEVEGYFMRSDYRIPTRAVAPGTPLDQYESAALTALPVKSIIAKPKDGAQMGIGPIRISGAAWAGEEQIVSVEISTDGGRAWTPAKLGAERARYAWRLWENTWTPPEPGAYTVMSRATDTAGRTQPFVSAWNPRGYLWNAVDCARYQVIG